MNWSLPSASFYKPSNTVDPEFIKKFAEIANAHYAKQDASAATDPISLGGSSSSRGSVGDEVKIKSKSISADDVKKELKSKEFRPTFNLAKGELNQLTAKCTALRSELSKVTNELDKEQRKEKMDTANIADLTDKQTKLEEQIELIEKAIKGYRTLTEQGVSGITGENGEDLMAKNQEAFDAISNLTDTSLADLGLQTGNLNQVAKKAFEYKRDKIAELSENYDSEVSAKHSERAENASGSASSKPSQGTTQRIKTAERQRARAEKSGNVDAQIKAQEDVVAGLEQQVKDSEKARTEQNTKLNEQQQILYWLRNANDTTIYSEKENKDIIKLLEKYSNGFTLTSQDKKQKVTISSEQIQQALNAAKNRSDTGSIARNAMYKTIANIGTSYDMSGVSAEAKSAATCDKDAYIYTQLTKLTDEEFLAMISVGNNDRASYNFNQVHGSNHTNQNLVESLFDGYDADLSMMYILARTEKLARERGYKGSDEGSLQSCALDNLKAGNLKGLASLQDSLDGKCSQGGGEEWGLQQLLYGNPGGSRKDWMGAGLRTDGLAFKAAAMRDSNGEVKKNEKGVSLYSTIQYNNLPKIKLAEGYVSNDFKPAESKPDEKLQAQLNAAKAKLEELKAKQEAAPTEEPTQEPAVQSMTDDQINAKALEIIRDAKIDTTKDGWKELAKAEVDKLNLQDSVKKQLKAVIDATTVEVRPDAEAPTAEVTQPVPTTPEQLANTFGKAVLNTNMTREELFPLVNSASNMVVNTSYTLRPNTVFRRLPQANQDAVLNTNLGYGTLFGSSFLTATDTSASAEQRKAYADAVTDVLKNQFRFAQIMSSPADHKFTKDEIIAMRNFLKAEYVGDGMNPEHKAGITFLIDNCAQLSAEEKTEFKKLLEE